MRPAPTCGQALPHELAGTLEAGQRILDAQQLGDRRFSASQALAIHSAAAMFWNMVLTLWPRRVMAAMHTTAISPTKRPYSTSEAPSSFLLRKPVTAFLIFSSLD